jgi:haloalkane dehalogenase
VPVFPAGAIIQRATVSDLSAEVVAAFADQDPIFRGLDVPLQKAIPGAAGQPHTTIEAAGHFLQEDQGEHLAEVVVDFMVRS